MTREELKKGALINKEHSAENDTVAAVHYVLINDEKVGVGLFHGDNEHCTIAMIKDFKGNPLGQEDSAGYPTTAEELEQLDHYFHQFVDDSAR